MMRAILVILFGMALAASAQPSRIILFRHAEKPEDPKNPHLSEAGQARAERLLGWLLRDKILGTNGLPVALYAPEATRQTPSRRPIETLEPTAAKLKLKIQAPYRASDYDQLAHEILSNKSLRGKSVIICWVHDYLPQFAAALGVHPPPGNWKSSDFESAYLITFEDGKASLQFTKQKLRKL